MILKATDGTELEITPDRFERIVLGQPDADGNLVYRQAQEGEADFPFREVGDNWINLDMAFRAGGRPELRSYQEGDMLPEEAYALAEWLQEVAKGEWPSTGAWFIEPAFQDVSVVSSTPSAITVRFEWGLGGPPFPDVVELEMKKPALLQAGERLEAELLDMFHRYNYPSDLIGGRR